MHFWKQSNIPVFDVSNTGCVGKIGMSQFLRCCFELLEQTQKCDLLYLFWNYYPFSYFWMVFFSESIERQSDNRIHHIFTE